MLEQFLKESLTEKLCAYQPVHPVSDRAYWEAFGTNMKPLAEETLQTYEDDEIFQSLRASWYMEFVTKKDRRHFEDRYYRRRAVLSAYVFLEAIENDGKHLEKIVDLLWMISEETEWSLPAHIGAMETSDALPWYKNPCLDLFCAETGALVSVVYAILKEKLDRISKNICLRIEDVLHERIVQNYLNHNYKWMGLEGQKVNNWNAWINSNVLLTALNISKDPEEKEAVVRKVMQTLDIFLNQCPDDGACDEGPGYWGKAALSAMETLYLLDEATNGYVQLWDSEKLKNMAEFVVNAYIGKRRFVNFADAAAFLGMDAEPMYRFGKKLHSLKLLSMAKELSGHKVPFSMGYKFKDTMKVLCVGEERADLRRFEGDFEFVQDCYLPSIQFFTAREKGNGLFLAAKGGHNDESHNHNDIGSFMIYKNGVPFFADAGVMEYSAKTFNPETRYTLWNNQSDYHSVPQIDGKGQKEGRTFAAKNPQYQVDGACSSFSLDMAEAYENKADIICWNRSFVLDRIKKEIQITEQFRLKRACPVRLHFLCCMPPEQTENGFVFRAADGTTLLMQVPTAAFHCAAEEIVLTDPKQNLAWGEKLYRMVLSYKEPQTEGEITYVFA